MSSAQSDAIREQLGTVIALLRPYAMSSGTFTNLPDVKEAVILARTALERVERLLGIP